MADENGVEAPVAAEAAPTPEGAPVAPQTDEIDAARSYTGKDVSEIVQKRLKNWSEFGKPDDVRSRLARLEQLEKFTENLRGQFQGKAELPGQGAQPPETEQDKQVRSYMEKMYPALKNLNDYQRAMAQQVQSLDQFRWQTVTERNSGQLKGWAKESGYKEEHMDQLETHVANSLRGNQADLQAYLQSGDSKIVKRHFEAVDKFLKGFSPSPAPSSAPVARASDAAKKANLPPRMPPGGVPAVTAKPGRMTDAQRQAAAFEIYSKGQA